MIGMMLRRTLLVAPVLLASAAASAAVPIAEPLPSEATSGLAPSYRLSEEEIADVLAQAAAKRARSDLAGLCLSDSSSWNFR